MVILCEFKLCRQSIQYICFGFLFFSLQSLVGPRCHQPNAFTLTPHIFCRTPGPPCTWQSQPGTAVLLLRCWSLAPTSMLRMMFDVIVAIIILSCNRELRPRLNFIKQASIYCIVRRTAGLRCILPVQRARHPWWTSCSRTGLIQL